MASKKKKAKQSPLLIIGIVVLALIILPKISSNKLRGPVPEPVEIIDEYPALYTSADLPQYPEGSLISIGSQQTSLEEGLRLTLMSNASVDDIVEYYDTALRAMGWSAPDQAINMDDLYLGDYTSGNMHYQLVVSRLPDSKESRISIVYSEE